MTREAINAVLIGLVGCIVIGLAAALVWRDTVRRDLCNVSGGVYVSDVCFDRDAVVFQ